jgi:ribosome biogenesis GTPase
LQATIYKSTGSWYTAGTGTSFIQCRIRGKFKNDELITSTNPVAVGDVVDLESQPGEETAVISGIHPRKNYMVRVSPHNYNQKHIIASNIDLAVLVVTLRQPRTSQGFIDRFLVTAEAYHISALLVFNKSDLFTESDREKAEVLGSLYREVGYGVLVTSAREAEGMDPLMARLQGLTSLFAGHSGSGKSSIVNQLMPGIDLRTQPVSGWSGKGMHTTTFAQMYDLPGSGKVIDTPGLREYGLVDVSPALLSHYFPEMRKLLPQCRFSNCIHVDEPGCAVKVAVDDGKISAERYISYLGILETLP